jgi:Photosynthesis system II assembly factor YCF48/Putative zinc-finger
VRQRLQTNTKLAEHPEPNLLNAFVEQSLSERERLQVLQHLSQCVNCREVVALSTAQLDVAGAVSLAPARAGWLAWPGLRWVAAVACIVVVGAAITIHQRRESAPDSPMQASVSIPAIVDKATPPQSADLNPAPVQAAEQRPSRKASGNHRAADAAPFELADARTASPFAEVVPGRAKDAVAGPQGAEQAVGGPTANNGETAVSGTFFPDDLATANLAPRWSLSWDGILQRSLDSGRTWQTVPVATHLILRALAANGLDIWVGGKAGALFHSSDAGQHWAQVLPIANGQAFVGDIVGVEFSDGLHGKLTSSNREIWITSDAGQTWQKQ